MSSPDKFATLSTVNKWARIKQMMDNLQSNETAYSLRRRFNTHHPIEQAREEARAFRVGQYVEWLKVKDLYAEHRDELSNTQDDAKFEQCKEILEKIFTSDLDQALHEALDD